MAHWMDDEVKGRCDRIGANPWDPRQRTLEERLNLMFCCSEGGEGEQRADKDLAAQWRSTRAAATPTMPSACGARVGGAAHVVGRVEFLPGLPGSGVGFRAPLSGSPVCWYEVVVEHFLRDSDGECAFRVASECQATDFLLTDARGGTVRVPAAAMRPLSGVRAHLLGARAPGARTRDDAAQLPPAIVDLLRRRGVALAGPEGFLPSFLCACAPPREFDLCERWFAAGEVVSAVGVLEKGEHGLALAPLRSGGDGAFAALAKHAVCRGKPAVLVSNDPVLAGDTTALGPPGAAKGRQSPPPGRGVA